MKDSIGHKKKAMIEALEKSLGIVTTACKTVSISRDTHYRWLKDDPEYKKAVDDIENIALDFAESQLHKQIQKGEVTSTIFFLKTKGKKRGYSENKELSDDRLGYTVPQITIKYESNGTGTGAGATPSEADSE